MNSKQAEKKVAKSGVEIGSSVGFDPCEVVEDESKKVESLVALIHPKQKREKRCWYIILTIQQVVDMSNRFK